MKNLDHSDLSLKLKREETIDRLILSLVKNPGLWRHGYMSTSDINNLTTMALDASYVGKYTLEDLDRKWKPMLDLKYIKGSRPWQALIAFYVWPEYLYLLDCDYKEVEMLAKIGNPIFTHYLHSIKILGTYKG